MSLDIQLEGSIKFAPVDTDGTHDPLELKEFGCEISSLVITRTRQSVTRPPTFCNAQQIQRAGAKEDSVTINFIGDETDALDFWSMAWDASENPPCELYFEATMLLEAPSATNPVFSGIVMVTDLDAGGTVNEVKQQSKTWPAREITKGIAAPV